MEASSFLERLFLSPNLRILAKLILVSDNDTMLGLTTGFIICLLIAFLLWRFVFPRAISYAALRKMALLSTFLSLFLIGLMFLAWRISAYNRSVISAEPLTSSAALANHDSRTAVVVGQLNDSQADISGTSYAAYLRWPSISDGDPEDIEYELPALMLAVGSDEFIEVDGLTYDAINWQRAEEVDYIYEFIDQGDEIVVAGELYEGGSGTHAGLYLTPRFVFAGDYEMFSAEYAPTLQRTATYAQIIQYGALVAALLTLLSPLPHAIHLRKTHSG